MIAVSRIALGIDRNTARRLTEWLAKWLPMLPTTCPPICSATVNYRLTARQKDGPLMELSISGAVEKKRDPKKELTGSST